LIADRNYITQLLIRKHHNRLANGIIHRLENDSLRISLPDTSRLDLLSSRIPHAKVTQSERGCSLCPDDTHFGILISNRGLMLTGDRNQTRLTLNARYCGYCTGC